MLAIPEVSRPMDKPSKRRLSSSVRLSLQNLVEPPALGAFLLNSQSLSSHHLPALLINTLFGDPGLQPLHAILPSNPVTSEAMPSVPWHNTESLEYHLGLEGVSLRVGQLDTKALSSLSSTNRLFKYSS